MMVIIENYAKNLIQNSFKHFFTLISTQTHTGTLNHFHSKSENPLFNMYFPNNDCNINNQELKTLLEKEKTPCSWCLTKTTVHLAKDLLALGFKQTALFTGMLIRTVDYQISGDPFKKINTSYEIKLVKNNEMIDDMMIPLGTAFHFSTHDVNILNQQYKKLFKENSTLRHYVLYHNKKPIASGSLLIQDTLAGFYNLAVLPEYHHSGIGTAMQEFRLQMACELDCEYAVLQASAMAKNLDKKMGFKAFDDYYFYSK